MNLSICIPARDMLHSGFAYDLAMLTAHWYARMPAGAKMNVHMSQGTLIADQRQKLAQMAIKAGADYCLFLDSDMRFPRNVVERLANHGKDIVAANYATRRIPVQTVAFSDFEAMDRVSSHDREGIEKIDAIGMGCMLVKTSVFKRIPLPWFNVVYSHAGQAFVGEDIFFCKAAKMAGIDVWVDHDVSKDVKHIGSLEFTHDHVAACEADLQKLEAAE